MMTLSSVAIMLAAYLQLKTLAKGYFYYLPLKTKLTLKMMKD